jgi:hypothetical protein
VASSRPIKTALPFTKSRSSLPGSIFSRVATAGIALVSIFMLGSPSSFDKFPDVTHVMDKIKLPNHFPLPFYCRARSSSSWQYYHGPLHGPGVDKLQAPGSIQRQSEVTRRSFSHRS